MKQKQIEIARKYVGQKEKPSNIFDPKSPLGKILIEAGHKDGEAWCAYFAEAVFVETLRSLFSASAVQTFHNFKNAGLKSVMFLKSVLLLSGKGIRMACRIGADMLASLRTSLQTVRSRRLKAIQIQEAAERARQYRKKYGRM